MSTADKARIRKKLILKAIANGWTTGEEKFIIIEKDATCLEQFIFDTAFGRALWGEEMIVLRDIKTTRGQTISEEAWRFHQHILLDFLQTEREDIAYEYLQEFIN